MNPAFFRDFAQRVRGLIPSTRTEAARRQLAIWAEEFEQRAEVLEGELRARPTDEPNAD